MAFHMCPFPLRYDCMEGFYITEDLEGGQWKEKGDLGWVSMPFVFYLWICFPPSLTLPHIAGSLTWEIMLGRFLCKWLPARFRQWEIPEGDRMQKKVRSQGMLSPLPCLGGSWGSSCFCGMVPASSGQIHCDSASWVALALGFDAPSLLCLSSTRRGGHTLKMLTSGSPRLSRLALSVPLTPLILGHLLFPRLLLQILSLLPLCAPTFTIFIKSKGLCNPSRERKRKRPKSDVDTYQF